MKLVKFNSHSNLSPFTSIFDDILGPEFSGGFFNESTAVRPAVNVLESKDEFGIEVAAPGMKKEDFSINLDKGVISISASKEVKEDEESNENDIRYTRREFGFSSFKRSFKLPKTVDTESIKASYEDGILKVVLPKKEEAVEKPARNIKIG